MKFMGCMNLTTATLALGIILILRSIICVTQNLYLEIFSIIFGIMCCCVVAKPHSIGLRKALIIMFVIDFVLFILSIVIIMHAISDRFKACDFLEEISNEYDAYRPAYNAGCDTKTKIIFYGTFVAYLVTGLIISIISFPILFKGKQEQIEYA